jgi:hypothetical protein
VALHAPITPATSAPTFARGRMRVIQTADDRGPGRANNGATIGADQRCGCWVKMGKGILMRAHKFSVGQVVAYIPPRGSDAPGGAYQVTAELSLRSGQLGYRIKHPYEEHDRVAAEADLSVLWN